MTVYVIRDGALVEKVFAHHDWRSTFPAPNVSRFTAMESPVTGKEITSWGERDRDMAAVGAVDPRDLPRKPFEDRRKANARSREA